MKNVTKTTWRKVRLGDVVDIHLGGTPARKRQDFWNGNIKWISIQDIVNSGGRYIRKTVETITEDGVYSSPAKILPKDTIVISSRGTVGELGLLSEPMTFNQSCYGLISKDLKNLDQIFLYYGTKLAIKRSKALAHGGVFNTFTKETFNHIDFQYPEDLNEQKRIAGILSAFDDKIENNNKIIKTLEQMAQEIFKEWFVKFRFPGHEKVEMVDSELGRIPKGWKIKELGYLLNRLPTPIFYVEKELMNSGDIAVYDQSSKIILGYHNNKADFNASSEKPIIIFGDHTCRMELLDEPFSVGPNVLAIIGNNGYSTSFVFYLMQKSIVQREYKRHWNELISKLFIVSTTDLAIIFSKKINLLIEAKAKGEKENKKLIALRDLLLPKLMSGKL